MGKLEKIASGVMILGASISLGGTIIGLVNTVYEPAHIERPKSKYFDGEELSSSQYNLVIGGGFGGLALFSTGGAISLVSYRLKERKKPAG